MNNKKILMSFLLVVLIAISVSAVSAEDAADVVAAEEPTDVIAVDEAADVVAETIKPATADAAGVQSAIDLAKTGDTVDISNNALYDFTNNTVTISTDGIIIDGKGTTTIKGYGDGNGILYINKAKNVIIQGINFIDTNPKNNFTYNGTTAGWGIGISAANDGLVKDCTFKDFNSGLCIMQTKGFTVENNKFEGGYSTLLANDPTVNKEQGSKSLNIYRQSSGIIVKNNSFVGPILDGVSIAQGSGSNQVIGNYFEGNCYSIYFGGASTVGSLIKNNTFVNCGFFKEEAKGIFWEGLPVISIQKSSDSIAIEDNTFEAIDNNILIAAEKGNEAHGFPTPIGDINITGNTILAHDSNVKADTVTLFHILVRDASLEVKDPINVTGNKLLSGMKGISLWVSDNEILSVPEGVLVDTLYDVNTIFNTTLTVDDVKVYAGDKGVLKVTLKDSTGAGLFNKMVTIVVNDNPITGFTDKDGVVEIPIIEQASTIKYVTAAFLGEGNLYSGSVDTAKILVYKKATTLTAKKATLKAKKAAKIAVALKSGKAAVAGKKVTITIKGVTFKAFTNAKGLAYVPVKVAKKGTYVAQVKFLGDTAYKAAKVLKIKVVVK